jgi:hypothetical protein
MEKRIVKPYSFLSEEDPTDEQLEELMLCVLEDVKARHTEAQDRYKKKHEEEIEESKLFWHQKTKKNED